MIYVLSMLPLPFQFSNLHDNTNPETALPRFLDPRCAQVHSYPSRLPSRNLATPRTPNCSGKVFRMTELTCVHKQPVLPCAATEVDSAILKEIDSKCGWSSTTSIHRNIQRAYSRNNPFLNIHSSIMKFFASISSFLLLLTLAIAVNAATDAEKACGFVKKVGTPCTIKLDGSKTITGTCQRKSGIKVFRHRTCVPNGTGAGAGASTDASASSSPASSPDTSSTSTSSGDSASSSSA
ncbi:hypothetical protein F5878DRAFT_627323 [Lentinula raphanica]|uniref:Uncharacterized protein n=1 Tax=Lentinula raphanica TaxID=153919 RepID=A0AA38P3I6_9AGAR|nr:hypothetical protein F5878DRAFT_627323 [Lentinula raphanica]